VQGQDGDGVILPLADADGNSVGTDPTGWSCKGTIQSKGGVTIHTWDSTTAPAYASVIVHESTLAVSLTWDKEQMANWSWSEGRWDLFVIQPPDDDSQKVCKGKAFLEKALTNA
jgi:hypothetical protein